MKCIKGRSRRCTATVTPNAKTPRATAPSSPSLEREHESDASDRPSTPRRRGCRGHVGHRGIRHGACVIMRTNTPSASVPSTRGFTTCPSRLPCSSNKTLRARHRSLAPATRKASVAEHHSVALHSDTRDRCRVGDVELPSPAWRSPRVHRGNRWRYRPRRPGSPKAAPLRFPHRRRSNDVVPASAT